MISGITVFDKILYLASVDNFENKTALYRSPVEINKDEIDNPNGYVWNSMDNRIYSAFRESARIAFIIPAEFCFAKKVNVDTDLIKKKSDIQKWIAGIQLPGDLAKYIYGFIPLRQDIIGGSMEVLFYAAIADTVWPVLWALVEDSAYDKITIIPEYLALLYYARRLINELSLKDLALVNFGPGGSAVVISENKNFIAARYFPSANIDRAELLEDIQTFIMSYYKLEENLALILTGNDFPAISELEPKFTIYNKNIEAGFATVSGAVDFIISGEKCELRVES